MTETTSERDSLRVKNCFSYAALVVVMVIVYMASVRPVTVMHSVLGSMINVTNSDVNTETGIPAPVNATSAVAPRSSTHNVSTATYPGTLAELGRRWIEEKGYSGFLKDLKVVTYTPNVTSQPVRLEPSVVADVASTLLVYVYSAVTHFRHRQRVRETWGNPRVYENTPDSNLRPTVIFVLAQPWGNPDYDVIMRNVTEESLRHGDIILFDIGEHYDNLTLKGLATMNWVLESFSHVQLFLKADDDLMLNLFWWLDVGEMVLKDPDTIYTHTIANHFAVVRKGHWGVTREEFPEDFYPKYCSGHGYLLSRRVIQRLLSVVPEVPLLRMEDVFLTGLLAEKAGVQHFEPPHEHKQRGPVVDARKPGHYDSLWRMIQKTSLGRNRQIPTEEGTRSRSFET